MWAWAPGKEVSEGSKRFLRRITLREYLSAGILRWWWVGFILDIWWQPFTLLLGFVLCGRLDNYRRGPGSAFEVVWTSYTDPMFNSAEYLLNLLMPYIFSGVLPQLRSRLSANPFWRNPWLKIRMKRRRRGVARIFTDFPSRKSIPQSLAHRASTLMIS
jgi:hypothetical protein